MTSGMRPDPELSLDDLMRLAYDDLHAIARRYLRREEGYQTLQTTALVHEAFLRLRGRRKPFRDKTHLLAAATTEMRRVLVDHARARLAERRGQRPKRVEILESLPAPSMELVDILSIDEALEALSRNHSRIARVAELRLLCGMSVSEASKAVGVSPRTIKSDWRFARSWIARRLRAPRDPA